MNEVIFVTKEQYDYCRKQFAGIIFHNYDKIENVYSIKIGYKMYEEIIKQYLNK